MDVRGGLRIVMQVAALCGIGLAARTAQGSPADDQLLATLHQVNQFGVQAGRLAQHNGSTARVRRYGRTLIRDHRQADRQVRQYARSSRMDVVVAPAPEAELTAACTRLHNLQSLHGSVFDQDFAHVTIDTSQRAVELVNRGRRQTTDRRLRVMLGQIALSLRQHKQMAADLLHRKPARHEVASRAAGAVTKSGP